MGMRGKGDDYPETRAAPLVWPSPSRLEDGPGDITWGVDARRTGSQTPCQRLRLHTAQKHGGQEGKDACSAPQCGTGGWQCPWDTLLGGSPSRASSQRAEGGSL